MRKKPEARTPARSAPADGNGDAPNPPFEGPRDDSRRPRRRAAVSPDEAVARLRSAVLATSDPPAARRVGSGAARGVALLILIAAVAFGLWTMSRGADAPPDLAVRAEREPAGSTAAAGVAEMFVVTLLGDGTEQLLEPFTEGPVLRSEALPGDVYVQNVAAVDVDRQESGWTVVVAAQVLRRVEGGYGDADVAYYRIELTNTDPPTVRALPEEVTPTGLGWTSARGGGSQPGATTPTVRR